MEAALRAAGFPFNFTAATTVIGHLSGGSDGRACVPPTARCFVIGMLSATIRRSVYVSKGKHHVGEPKGLRAKPVPITGRLLDALKAVRHLRGERVLYTDEGGELTPRIVRMWIEKAEKRAGLPVTGRIHIFRHTFCSHGAMAGVPAMTVKELARHASLATTMRYMHLSPSALDEGIAMLAKSREAGGAVVVKAGVK